MAISADLHICFQIKGFPPSVTTRKELIDIVHRFIWLVTGQHAAVSFPLSDYGIYAPNAPTKLYNDTRGPEGQFSIYNLPYRTTSAVSYSNTTIDVLHHVTALSAMLDGRIEYLSLPSNMADIT
jgi:hypothetical protein